MAKAIFNDNFERLTLKECSTELYSYQDMDSVNKYSHIIGQTALIMYNRLKYKFDRVGYDLDDVRSVTTYYALHYFGLYSIKNNKKEREKYNKRNVKQSIFTTERNKLIAHLRQRITILGEYCDKKSRNIIVGRDSRNFFAFTVDSVAASGQEIVERYKELGYRKVSAKEMAAIKKNRVENKGQAYVDKDGFNIVEVNHIDQGISPVDYMEITSQLSTLFYMKPEDALEHKEEECRFNVFVNKYKKMDKQKKVNMMRLFVEKNKNNSRYIKEVALAKRYLHKRHLLEKPLPF